jgi:hypothetical protein
MFTKIKEFLFGKPAEVAAPYKVEAPAPTEHPKVEAPAPEPVKCGCGRSSTGFCVGLHKLSEDEWAKHPDNKTAVAAPKKAPAKKQQFEKKEAAPKAEAKPKAPPKPRAPRKAPVAK